VRQQLILGTNPNYRNFPAEERTTVLAAMLELDDDA